MTLNKSEADTFASLLQLRLQQLTEDRNRLDAEYGDIAAWRNRCNYYDDTRKEYDDAIAELQTMERKLAAPAAEQVNAQLRQQNLDRLRQKLIAANRPVPPDLHEWDTQRLRDLWAMLTPTE